MFNVLRSPSNFPLAARILQFWYEQKAQIPAQTPTGVNNVTLPAGYRIKSRQNAGTFDPNQATAPQNAAPNAINGITCVDSRFHPSPLNASVYQDIYSRYNRKTKYGTDSIISGTYGCM
jgi:hypothetical protein